VLFVCVLSVCLLNHFTDFYETLCKHYTIKGYLTALLFNSLQAVITTCWMHKFVAWL
jgi:hypothetical protein